MARLLLALLLMPLTAVAADEQRLSFLEQEVRNLQRQVMTLSRQLDELRTRPDRPSSTTSAVTGAASPVSSDQWLDGKKWRQLSRGMSELEVIGMLGPPTSMRTQGSERVLLYAMEIGSSGFLGGSVTLRDRAVSEVRPPILQ
jgi:hypothetical protein